MKKSPKASVYFCDSPSGIYLELTGYAVTDQHYPVSVVPCVSAARAKKLVRWANLSRDQKIKAINKILCARSGTSFKKWPKYYDRDSAELLNLIEGVAL